MNTLHHLLKLLDKHHAYLAIDDRAEPPELLLRLPARGGADGTLGRYALEYRLGQQLPPSTSPQPELLESDPTA
jgi:hypothetical protein